MKSIKVDRMKKIEELEKIIIALEEWKEGEQ